MPRNTGIVILLGVVALTWLAGQSDEGDRVTPPSSPSVGPLREETPRALPSTQSPAPDESKRLRAPSATAPVQRTTPIYVTGSTVRVRTGPGTTYDRIAAFKKGTKLVFLGDQSGKWRKIKLGEVEGWMHGDYLSFKAPTAAAAATPAPSQPRQQPAPAVSDRALIQRLIRQSIARYPSSCPCPFNRDRAGGRCGKRSAWSRPGGAAPICFASDVTPSMLARERR